VEYRLANESLVQEVATTQENFFGADVQKVAFEDHDGIVHTALCFGELGSLSNVRVHNVMPDIELLLQQNKYNNLIGSIEYLKEHSGVLVFINKTHHQDNAAPKEFGIGAQIIKHFGIKKMNLLSATKQIDFVGLSGFGLEVNEVISL
jgi:3,4-dihydroxy 2-butanone 4-phosphate synthase/GTP cyclohydrolase II